MFFYADGICTVIARVTSEITTLPLLTQYSTALMASTDAILSSPVASDSFKSKFLASPADAIASSSSKRLQVKMELSSGEIACKQQQHQKPRFALELDGLNCFETLVPR